DPQMFAAVYESAVDKIPPLEVADWLNLLAYSARKAMAGMSPTNSAEFRRWQLDVQILSGLGLFFSHKISAAKYWHDFETTKNREFLQTAIRQYSTARDAWSEFAALAKDRY